MLMDFRIEDGKIVAPNTGAKIPLTNSFVKEVASVAAFTLEISAIWATREARARVALQKRPVPLKISFTPQMPQVWYAIWPVCHLAGIEIVRDPAQADILFYFEDREFTQVQPLPHAGKYMLNGDCLDIRKSRVAEVFQEVFGYGLSIDPYTHSGLALMKSERNGVHDGQIVPCPYVVPRKDYVFQRLVENTLDGHTYTDIRTPVVGGALPIIYLKNRTASTRFSNENASVSLTSADEQFTPEEQARILAFARRINLDFGGLDILRDRRDGRIYIVDVNKTDMGPPTALPRPQKLIAMQKLADTFRAHVVQLLDVSRAA